MKKILLIATGGTIASKSTNYGLEPGINSEELLECVPEAKAICDITAEQLFNLDSSNMSPLHWLKISERIRQCYRYYDGFVITHGTDTMAYTAAALSYLIQLSPKPILLTGSQKSIYARNTDARRNLVDALRYAVCDQAHGVGVVFNGRALIGTRARKTRTRSFNAFSSIDYPDLAVIQENRIICYIEPEYESEPVFYEHLNPKVFLLPLVPGMDGDIFDSLADKYDALVVESFGMGGIPAGNGTTLMEAVRRFTRSGHILVLTTQVPHEGCDLEVYQVGQQTKNELDIIEAHNMTIEAIMTKMMWILGQTKDPETVRMLFCSPVAKDLL